MRTVGGSPAGRIRFAKSLASMSDRAPQPRLDHCCGLPSASRHLRYASRPTASRRVASIGRPLSLQPLFAQLALPMRCALLLAGTFRAQCVWNRHMSSLIRVSFAAALLVLAVAPASMVSAAEVFWGPPRTRSWCDSPTRHQGLPLRYCRSAGCRTGERMLAIDVLPDGMFVASAAPAASTRSIVQRARPHRSRRRPADWSFRRYGVRLRRR